MSAAANQLKTFREKVRKLQKEWKTSYSGKGKIVAERKISKKLKRGLRTPEDAFRIPILNSLNELGGKAKVSDVLKKVHQKMKNKLNNHDLSPHPFILKRLCG